MISLEEFNRLKKQVDKIRKQQDRADGARDQLLEQLKEKFDCGSVEEAKKLLREKERKRDKLESQLDKKIKEFEKKWGDLLSDDDTKPRKKIRRK